MAYKFRNAVCPYCEHEFMWRDDTEWIPFYYYENDGIKENVAVAECPKCSKDMFLRPHVLRGYLEEEAYGGCIHSLNVKY